LWTFQADNIRSCKILKNCAVSIIDLTDGELTIEQEGAIYYQTEERPKDILN
jgi:hypothetical protein